MHQSIPKNVAIGIIIAVVLIAGFFWWQRSNVGPPTYATGNPASGTSAGSTDGGAYHKGNVAEKFRRQQMSEYERMRGGTMSR
jgi:hypothetical protein